MRQANGVGATPWDELELDDPVQFGQGFVTLFPVAVQADDLVVEVVDHHDVRGALALAVRVLFKRQPCVDVVHAAQAVLAVLVLTALDLVVGLLGGCLLRLHGRTHRVDVAIQATGHALIELPLGDVLHLSGALRGVEVGRCERQQDVVDGDELGAGAALGVVVPEFQELRTTHGQLREHLLHLVAELLDLLGQLPVHVVALALGDLGLGLGHLAQNLGAGRAIRWEQLLHGA